MVLMAILVVFGLLFLLGGSLQFIAAGSLLGLILLLGAGLYLYKMGFEIPTRIFPLALLALLGIGGLYFLLGGGISGIATGTLLGALLLIGAGYTYLKM